MTQGQFGNFSLTCENFEVVNGVVPTVRLYPVSHQHILMLVYWNIQLLTVISKTKQNNSEVSA